MKNAMLSYREAVDHIANVRVDNRDQYMSGELEHETYLQWEAECYGMVRIVAHIYDVPFLTVYEDVTCASYRLVDENEAMKMRSGNDWI